MQEYNYEKESMIKDYDVLDKDMPAVNMADVITDHRSADANRDSDETLTFNIELTDEAGQLIQSIKSVKEALSGCFEQIKPIMNEIAQQFKDACSAMNNAVNSSGVPAVTNSRMKFSGHYGSDPYYRRGRYDQHRGKGRKR